MKNENANITMSNNLVELRMMEEAQINQANALLNSIDDTLVSLHEAKDIHIHDYGFFMTRWNCCQHRIYRVVENGLQALSCLSKPAKKLSALLSHVYNTLSLGQAHMAGGQGIPDFNVWMAPFVRGLSDEDLKQCVQNFIFQLNQISATRGGLQTAFTSVNMAMEIPEYMREMDCIRMPGKYKDYEEELKRFSHMVLDVLLEKDGEGKPFAFPNVIFNIREVENVDMELMNKITKVMVETSNTYYINGFKYDDTLITAMGCRTQSKCNVSGDPFHDVYGTGNLAYITINLPRIALRQKCFNHNWKNTMRFLILKSAKILLARRNLAWQNWEDKMYPFFQSDLYSQNGEKYYDIGYTTMSLGVIGLADVMTVMGKDFDEVEFIDFFCDFVESLNQKTYTELAEALGVPYNNHGNEEYSRWSIIGSPAESCSTKMKEVDNKLFEQQLKDCGLFEKSYYENSVHVPVDSNYTAHEKLMKELRFHKQLGGGIISHIWNGSSEMEDYTSLSNYILKMFTETDLCYVTVSNVICYCEDCQQTYIGSLQDTECKLCGSNNLKFFQKITGYLSEVKNFNHGKLAEANNRNEFKI